MCRDPDVVADLDVTADSDLPACHHPRAQPGTAGHPELGCQHRSLPYRASVGDHDKIVELHTVADRRLADCRPVDRRVRPYIDVAADPDASDLRNRHRRPVRHRNEAEAVPSDHRTWLQNNIVADLDPLAHDRAGMGREAISDANPRINHHMRMENCIISDHNVVADNGKSSDTGACSYPRARAYHRARVNPRNSAWPLVEQPENARKRQVRVFDKKDIATARILTYGQNDRARSTSPERTSIPRIRHEGDLVRLRAFDRRCRTNLPIRVSAQLGPDRLGDFAQFPFSAFGHAPV